MPASRIRRIALISTVGLLAVAGTAAAFLLRSRRDVTTSSDEAYRLYRLGRENDEKLYDREAIAAYAEALKHDPNFVMATVRLAAHMMGRDPDRAKSLLQCVSRFRDEITPKEEITFRYIEEWLGKKDETKLAAIADECIRRFPDLPEGYLLRGQLCQRQGKLEEMEAQYKRLLKVNPNFAYAYNALGYYWLDRGEFGKAEENFKRYRFLAPDQANPYDSLGELYANTGRYEEAEESLKKALSVKPDFVASLGHLGTVEIGRGNYVAAAGWYRKALELADSAGAKTDWVQWMTFSLADAGKVDDALREAESWAAKIQNAPGAERARVEDRLAFIRARLLVKAGRLEEAETSLARINPPPADAPPDRKEDYERLPHILKGLIASERGRPEEAVAELKAGIPLRISKAGSLPDYPYQHFLRVLLAENLRKLGKTAEAEEALKPVFALNPKFHAAVEEMARLKGTVPAATVSENAARR